MATKRQIMLKCLRQLSMVYGSAVNKYAEEKLYSMLDDALDVCFQMRFWDRHIKKVKTGLSNGFPILDNLELVCADFGDIQTIMNNQSYPRELARANMNIIKDSYTGTVPTFFQRSEVPGKLFQIVPSQSDTEVWVIFRTLCKPDVYQKFLNGEVNIDPADQRFNYTAEDEMPFDELALRYYACWQYMVLKADNDAAANMYKGMFDGRIKSLTENELNDTLSYAIGPQQSYQHGWWTE